MAAVKMEVEDALEEEHGPLHKRHKVVLLSTNQQGAKSCVVDRQQSLGMGGLPVPPSQYNPLDEPSPLGLRLRKSPSLLELIQMKLSQSNTPKVGSQGHGRKECSKAAAASGDKLKASNFPGSLLKIGTWEYKSRHEGDLVAKCYFAKHKLVWEVLDGGLKNKIEIQWSDIMALKANYQDDGPGTLNVVLARQPLFFRETNPQPRKHTLWQATSDFTGGQASIHSLQDTASPSGPQSSSSKNDLDGIGRHSGSYPRETPSPTSDFWRAFCLGFCRFQDALLYCLVLPLSRSPGPFLHVDERSSQPSRTSDIRTRNIQQPDSLGEEWQSLQILDDINRCLFSDIQHSPDSDEKSLMSRVNSLCCLLQKDGSNAPFEGDLSQVQERENESNGKKVEGDCSMSRKDSVGDLLLNLPRIASLPQFLFNISEDFESQAR
ncbi:hypothetical protein DH2020_038354 [Rehmannia glutinosa]|uniref:TRF2/HOY1 PH-like domain-containing protein n=1 Tax=Rehmannia glutinosa TaxID=99300 RepID=A0ABR0UYT5_REHGL